MQQHPARTNESPARLVPLGSAANAQLYPSQVRVCPAILDLMNSSPPAAAPGTSAPQAPTSAGTASTSLVAVALMGSALPTTDALTRALDAHGAPVRFDVVNVDTIGHPVHADIVVCASAQVAAVAAMCRPDADVIVLVPARDDDSAVLAALESGATVCVRGADVGLMAAYVHAVVRRRDQTCGSST